MKNLAQLGLTLGFIYLLAFPLSLLATAGVGDPALVLLTALYRTPAFYLLLTGLNIQLIESVLPVTWVLPLFGVGYYGLRLVKRIWSL